MDIQTDFTPKPGDRVRYQKPPGRIITYVWVICPDCHKGRWVSLVQFKALVFTGRCKVCHTKLAKKTFWRGPRAY